MIFNTINIFEKQQAVLTLLLLVLSVFSVTAQDSILLSPPDHDFNAFLHQDREGFLWVSSTNGWYRTDGNDYTHFPVQPANSTYSFGQNIQSSRYEDSNGRYWFSTYDGLHVFDPNSETTNSYQVKLDTQTLEDGYRVLHIAPQSNNIWLVANQSIGQFDPGTQTFTPLPFTLIGNLFAIDTFPDGQLRSLVGCPWLEGKGFEILERPTPQAAWKYQYIQQAENTSLPGVTSALILNSSIYLGTSRGLASYHQHSGLTMLHESAPDLFSANGCFDLKLHPHGDQLVVSHKNDGIWIYPLDTLNQISANEVIKQPRTHNTRALYFDQQQRLWESIYGQGVVHYGLTSSEYINRETQGTNTWSDIACDLAGNIYGLSTSAELYQLSQRDEQWQLLFRPSQPISPLRLTFSQTRCYAYGQEGFYRYPMTSPSMNTYSFASSQTSYLRLLAHEFDHLLALGHDGIKAIWPKATKWETTVVPDPSQKPGWNFDYARYLGAGELLLAYQSKDLWVARWLKDSISVQRRISVNADITTTVPKEKENEYWIGTSDGLYESQADSAHYINLGLPFSSPDIKTILPYRENLLIIGTHQGLVLYNHQTRQSTLLQVEDGLPSNEFVHEAGIIDASGKCWLLTKGGIINFAVDSINQAKHQEKAYIKQIWINNAPYIADEPTHVIKQLRLRYWENNIQLNLSSINLTEPNRSRIKYRLLGFDSTFQMTPRDETIRFGQLVAGEYQLEFVALNGRLEEGKMQVLPIVIVPPIWQRWWFQLIAVSLFLLVLYLINQAIVRRKLRSISKALEQEKLVNEERNRIASEVHDDLGGDLSSILFLSEELIIDSEGDLSETSLNRIHALSKKSIQNIREIIFALDDRKSRLEDLIQQIERFGKDFFTEKSISFVARHQLENKDLVLSSREKRNFLQIVKEAFQNIFRHAQADFVNFSCEQNSAGLFIEIVDNGIGITASAEDENYRPGNNLGLDNMKRKAAAINAQLKIESSSEGTTIRIIQPTIHLKQ